LSLANTQPYFTQLASSKRQELHKINNSVNVICFSSLKSFLNDCLELVTMAMIVLF